MAFKRGTFEIEWNDWTSNPTKTMKTVEGYVFSKYLGIHRQGNKWYVDHLPTGAQITEYRLMATAKKAVLALAHLDWKFKSMHSPKIKAMGPEAKRIIAEVGVSE